MTGKIIRQEVTFICQYDCAQISFIFIYLLFFYSQLKRSICIQHRHEISLFHVLKNVSSAAFDLPLMRYIHLQRDWSSDSFKLMSTRREGVVNSLPIKYPALTLQICSCLCSGLMVCIQYLPVDGCWSATSRRQLYCYGDVSSLSCCNTLLGIPHKTRSLQITTSATGTRLFFHSL